MQEGGWGELETGRQGMGMRAGVVLYSRSVVSAEPRALPKGSMGGMLALPGGPNRAFLWPPTMPWIPIRALTLLPLRLLSVPPHKQQVDFKQRIEAVRGRHLELTRRLLALARHVDALESRLGAGQG